MRYLLDAITIRSRILGRPLYDVPDHIVRCAFTRPRSPTHADIHPS